VIDHVRSGHVRAADGTAIHFALHGRKTGRTPLLCLAGLTRHGGDFAPVVERFASDRPVLTIDMRGRGLSGHAAPQTYRPDVELTDVIDVLADLGIPQVAVLGTSRGGIIGMLMAALQPQSLAGLLLNDVGARLEPEGLLRITRYVGASPRFQNWSEATHAFAESQAGFKGVSPDQWQTAVKRIYRETPQGIGPMHDPGLALSLPSAEDIADGKTPELWSLLPSLANVPVSLLRGANSDLLSAETVARMQTALPHLHAVTVPGRGHVPFLDEVECTEMITRWLGSVDDNALG
jgi:pimeloyl-ACP methyl ester carboxylesterase